MNRIVGIAWMLLVGILCVGCASEDPHVLADRLIEANNIDNLLQTYKSVEVERYDMIEGERITDYYISEEVFFYDVGGEGVCYFDSSRMISSEYGSVPSYGVILDDNYYQTCRNGYKQIFDITGDGREVSIKSKGTISFSDSYGVFEYDYDLKNYLISEARYYHSDGTLSFKSVYMHNETDEDEAYYERTEQIINKSSNGKKHKVTIIDLNGNELTYDIPDGMSINLFSDSEGMINKKTGEYYGEEPIKNDEVFEVVPSEAYEGYTYQNKLEDNKKSTNRN